MPEVPTGRSAGPARSPLTPLGLSGSGTRGLRQLGATLAEIGIQRQREENRIKRSMLYAEKTTELLTAIQDLKRQADDAEDPEGLSEAFAQGSQDAVKQIRGSFEDDIVGSEFDAYATKAVAAGAYDVETISRGKRLDRARSQLPGQLLEIQKARAVAGTDIERRHLEQEGRTLIEMNPALSDTERARGILAFNRGNELSDYQAMYDSDLAGLVKVTSSPKAFQDAFPSLSEDDRITLRDNAQKARDEQIREANGAIRAELVVRIGRGQYPTHDAGEADIRAHRDRGVISDGEMANLILTWDNVWKSQMNDFSGENLVHAQVRGEITELDPRSKKHHSYVDAYYRHEVEPMIRGADPREAADIAAEYVGRVGMVPRTLSGNLRGALRVGTDQQVAEAADLFDRLRTEVPDIVNDFQAKDVALATAVTPLVRAGMPADRAVQLIKDAMATTTEQARKERQNRYRADAAGGESKRFLEASIGESDPFFGWFAGKDRINQGLTSKAIEIPDEMRAEFDNVAEQFAMMHGQNDAARRAAVAVLRNVWGITTIDGAPRWMKFAPETFYRERDRHGTILPSTEWMTRQLIQDVVENAVTPLPIPDGTAIDPTWKKWDHRLTGKLNLRIAPHLDTPREFDPETGRPTPSYNVFFVDEREDSPTFGAPTLIEAENPLTGEIEPMRVNFDYWVTPWGKARAEEMERIEERERARFKARRIFENAVLEAARAQPVTVEQP